MSVRNRQLALITPQLKYCFHYITVKQLKLDPQVDYES